MMPIYQEVFEIQEMIQLGIDPTEKIERLRLEGFEIDARPPRDICRSYQEEQEND